MQLMKVGGRSGRSDQNVLQWSKRAGISGNGLILLQYVRTYVSRSDRYTNNERFNEHKVHTHIRNYTIHTTVQLHSYTNDTSR